MEKQWQQQAELMGKQLDQLSNQLHSSQGKLEVLQRTTVHVKDDKQVRQYAVPFNGYGDASWLLIVLFLSCQLGCRENLVHALREAAR